MTNRSRLRLACAACAGLWLSCPEPAAAANLPPVHPVLPGSNHDQEDHAFDYHAGEDWSNTSFRVADLSNVDLSNTRLTNADLTNANLTSADLRNAVASEAITSTQLNSAIAVTGVNLSGNTLVGFNLLFLARISQMILQL